MEKILALALESRRSIRHDAPTLCGSDLTTQVRLAGLAELTLLTFWCADTSMLVETIYVRYGLTREQPHSLPQLRM